MHNNSGVWVMHVRVDVVDAFLYTRGLTSSVTIFKSFFENFIMGRAFFCDSTPLQYS